MLILVGDSHAGLMRKGFTAMAPDAQAAFTARFGRFRPAMLMPGRFFNRPFFSDTVDGVRFTGERSDAVFTRVTRGNAVFVQDDPRQFIFSLGFHAAWLMQAAQWSTMSLRGSTDRQHISSRAFRELMLNYNRHVFGFFEALQRRRARFAILASPPPARTFFEVRVKTSEDEYLSLQDAFRAAYARELERRRIVYITPPEGMIEGGFLRDEFASGITGDFHANEVYGAASLAKLIDLPRIARSRPVRP